MDLLQDLSPAALVAAIEANMAEFWKCFGRLPESQLHDEPDILWFATGAPAGSLNGVIRSRFGDDDADARIDDTLAHFKRRRLPMQWWVGPSSRPTDLGERLEAHDLACRPWRPPGMAVDLHRLTENLPAPTGLAVQPVNNEAALKKWIDAAGEQAELLARSGIDPQAPLRHYVGLLNGEPVGASSLLLAAGVASIQLVGTAPHARRLGIGSAMSLAAVPPATLT